MSKQGLASRGQHVSAQVWSGLSAERRAKAVRLMVQLALKLVTIQLDWRQEEVNDDKPIGYSQSTKWSS